MINQFKLPKIATTDYNTLNDFDTDMAVTNKQEPFRREPPAIVVSAEICGEEVSVKLISECPVTTKFLHKLLQLIYSSRGCQMTEEFDNTLKVKITSWLGADSFDYDVEVRYDRTILNEHIECIAITAK